MNDPPPAYPADSVKLQDQPPPPPIGYQPAPMVNQGGYPQPVLQQPHLNPNNPFTCLLYTSPSPRDATLSRMPSSA